MLERHRPFFYFFDDAVKGFPNHVGWCFHCIDIRLPLESYPVKYNVTFQGRSSASRAVLQAATFAKHESNKLIGTLFMLRSKSDKDVSVVSRFPQEEEVTFPFNSHFYIEAHVEDDAEKHRKLPELASYDLTDLLLIIGKQV